MVKTTEQELGEYAETAYLDYAMTVVTDRAIPHISDGLKPVQRRIVYAMDELGLDPQSKYKKSARTVGDVLGKYHPHGDSACYEAMALMAQPFSYRYPLIDGQGNWGSRDDPKSFAAMRYTEAKTTTYSKLLLGEIKFDTVDWKANFDGTMREPQCLPAKIPNILTNGTSGIAVGMSTDIPTHNLSEVIDATIHLLHHPEASVEDLMSHISGPDLPTKAEIISPKEVIKKIYETGRGSFKMRAAYHEESHDKIVIDALPHQASGEKILINIGDLITKKSLPMITNLRDESDHETPTRLVIEYKKSKSISVEEIMDHLFAQTDLEKNYRVNFNVITLQGKPQTLNLKEMLSEWLTFRKQTVIRKLNYHLRKINDRLHIIDGMLLAYLNLDRIIEIIRTEDNPKAVMIQEFNLSEIQATAILDTRLRHLAKLEEEKLNAEKADLEKRKAGIERTLSSDQKLAAYIANDLTKIKDANGDERQSVIIERAAAKAISSESLVSSDPVTVVTSKKGWVRMAKGHTIDPEALTYRTNDSYDSHILTTQDKPTIVISDQGKCYAIQTHTLPSARSQGEHVSSLISLGEQDRITQILAPSGDKYIVASTIGYGFTCDPAELVARKRGGKQLINTGSGQALPLVQIDSEASHVIVITKSGFANVFPIEDLPELTKGKGNKLISLSNDDQVAYVDAINIDQKERLIVDGTKIDIYRDSLGKAIGKRNRKGYKLLKGVSSSIYRERT